MPGSRRSFLLALPSALAITLAAGASAHAAVRIVTPAEAAQFFSKEAAQWSKVIKDANVTPQ
jgi:hypothetical protein